MMVERFFIVVLFEYIKEVLGYEIKIFIIWIEIMCFLCCFYRKLVKIYLKLVVIGVIKWLRGF